MVSHPLLFPFVGPAAGGAQRLPVPPSERAEWAQHVAAIELPAAHPLATIAAAVGLTPGQLTTIVRRKTGHSVQRWITERRMAEALRLLRETNLTIEAIAARAGYRQPSYFIKHFRRDHTATPATWRRSARSTHAPVCP